jgi:hypothetical protein
LAQHCWQCHGQDKAALAKTGGISLDSFAGATANHEGMQAIVPGEPEKSTALKLMASTVAEERMPPPSSGIKPLTADEIATIRTWISNGAEYSAHWAFVPPKLPSLPSFKHTGWVKNEIDRFILAKLEQEGLKPEARADKRTLIRRVTLTLTGLPPTPEEVNRFLADKRPYAYEKLVDRLLASGRFGENQARYWLDAVRYADTHGLHIDNERSVYPYRDWVVRAYNQDLPYNQFVLWQLAGDLLPNPTLDQKIATGYIRLNPTTNEGGAIEAEFLAKNTFDRVDTTATVFMGLTLQCAKCHDHKYDPLSQRDYYSMYAYFNSTADTPLDGNLKLHEPVMRAPTPEQAAHLALLKREMAALRTSVKPEVASEWEANVRATLPTTKSWEIAGPFRAADFDTAFANNFGAEPESPSKNLTWKPIDFQLDKPQPNLVGVENAAVYLRSKVTVAKANRVALRLGSDDGIKVWVNGALVHSHKVLRALNPNDDKVEVQLKQGENELLVKVVNATGQDGAFVGIGDPAVQNLGSSMVMDKDSGIRSPGDANIDRYLRMGPSTATAARYRKLAKTYSMQDAAVPMTYIAKELPMARPAFLLRRGQYDLPTEPVTRAVPAVFGKLSQTQNNNRLGLAEWMIDSHNPLTSRVMVNRIWQQHFGTGIVKSSEDFGSRGDWPSNPQLLDFLACRFVDDGWSIKKLTRLILTSSAYQQAATSTPAKRLKDPDNALVSRGPRFRLDAEVIRDTALYVAGLLVDRPGGHSDKPYQPPGLWEIIAYPISDTAKYKQDHGAALYRRSLYMFWKRTSPPPTMMLFDAPMRESCVVRRSRTNTPTQALATLNETGFVEDARAMAQRLLREKRDDRSRIRYAFELATGRPPSSPEMGVVKNFLAEARDEYRAHPAAAMKTLAIGESPRAKSLPANEHAAWTLVCNMLLNLDETLTLH